MSSAPHDLIFQPLFPIYARWRRSLTNRRYGTWWPACGFCLKDCVFHVVWLAHTTGDYMQYMPRLLGMYSFKALSVVVSFLSNNLSYSDTAFVITWRKDIPNNHIFVSVNSTDSGYELTLNEVIRNVYINNIQWTPLSMEYRQTHSRVLAVSRPLERNI